METGYPNPAKALRLLNCLRSARNNSPRKFECASFANQAEPWRSSAVEGAVECTWRRLGSFKGNSYYIRTISPYPYDIRTISVRYPKRTSAVRPYGIFTVSVRYLYGVCTKSSVHPAYGMYGSLPSILNFFEMTKGQNPRAANRIFGAHEYAHEPAIEFSTQPRDRTEGGAPPLTPSRA